MRSGFTIDEAGCGGGAVATPPVNSPRPSPPALPRIMVGRQPCPRFFCDRPPRLDSLRARRTTSIPAPHSGGLTNPHHRSLAFFTEHREASMSTASFDFPAPDHARQPIHRDCPVDVAKRDLKQLSRRNSFVQIKTQAVCGPILRVADTSPFIGQSTRIAAVFDDVHDSLSRLRAGLDMGRMQLSRDRHAAPRLFVSSEPTG